MLNTGVSAVLGLGYWAVAARFYSDADVGRGSAAIAAMKFLAGITAVTLIGGLARFIPVAGKTTRGLILRVYGWSSAIVALASVIFLATLDWWGPSYAFLHDWLYAVGFVAAVVGWSLLTLQDGVLTGLRSAKWVPVGNTVFSTAKLVLLVGLATVIPATGVFVSWGLCITLSIVPLGWLVFRRLVPRHVEATKDIAQPAGYREMGRFLAGDYTGALFSLAVVYLVPVIVASQVDSKDNAYFYITTTIGGTINLFAINMGASLTVEGSHHPALLAANCRAALRRMASIMVPICALLFLLAPHILGVFGPGYADAATPLLRWYAVGAVLRVVIEVYYGVLRAQSRTSGLAYLQGLLCVLVLSLTVALLPRMGLTGAGVAEISSLTLVASIAGWKLYRILRAAPKVPAGAVPAPDGDLADLAAHGDAGRGPEDAAVRHTPSWAARTAPHENEEPTLQLRADAEHLERHPSITPPRGTYVPEPPLRPSIDLRGLTERLKRPGTLLWSLLAVALLLYWLPLHGMGEAELERMGGLGLITVLPGVTLLGAALLVGAFAAGLWVARPHRVFLVVALVLTVVSLHAVPSLMEAQPRFPTAWQHLGFLDFIERTGTTAPDMDARWSWPGFFAGAAFLVQAAGVHDLSGLIRWWPTVIQLAYLAPLAVMLRAVKAHWRAKWCALWFFALCGWVGQDYFSPQGFTVLFYLLFIALLLVWFREPRALRKGKLRPGETDDVPGPERRRERAVLVLVLMSLFVASVAGHQLTPFVMTGVLIGLALARRTMLYGMPLLCAVLVAVWVGFLAEPYWAGHFDDLFGGIGGVGGNVSSSVSGRIEGGDPTHKLVLYVRVALAGGTLLFAGFGLLRRRWAGYSDRSLLVLAGLPFLAFGAQSYGGEIALRVFLFAAPAACVLAALAFWPRPSGHREGSRWRAHLPPLAALLAGLVLIFGFLVARWGNESFERTRTGEVAAMDYLYQHDKPTLRLLWFTNDTVEDVTPAMPWGEKDMERIEYKPTQAPVNPAKVAPAVESLREAGPNSYLIVNESQSTYLHLDAGYPQNWQQRVTKALDKRPELRRVLSNEDAVVYTLSKPSGAKAEPADPGPIGPQVTWTSWSVMGGLAAVALLLLLGAREVVRVATPATERRAAWLQSTFWFSLPLLMLFLGVLVQRFWTMS
ncbi:lipopolysaccharide biosynthesis protein [Streptomyces sp. ODS28]|uniref:lipopolysaccharide biosynthesis protein n=1 Tax=Streptomyces sp. ODS28 TaxID=3136688 RepID=UPI0031EA180B